MAKPNFKYTYEEHFRMQLAIQLYRYTDTPSYEENIKQSFDMADDFIRISEYPRCKQCGNIKNPSDMDNGYCSRCRKDMPVDIKIEELDLTVRTYNCLKKRGISTVLQLVQVSDAELFDIRNFGKKSLDEINSKLASMGIQRR